MTFNLAYVQVKKKKKVEKMEAAIATYLEPVFQFSNTLIVQELWLTPSVPFVPISSFLFTLTQVFWLQLGMPEVWFHQNSRTLETDIFPLAPTPGFLSSLTFLHRNSANQVEQ